MAKADKVKGYAKGRVGKTHARRGVRFKGQYLGGT
jgi:hypothetical protein